MAQDLKEKMAAVASVLWLLPKHYSMIHIGRSGVHFRNELEQPELAGWVPPVPQEFEGWPLEEIKAWFSYQKHLSAKYRLYSVGRALEKLEKRHPEQAAAVKMKHIEIPTPEWYEPYRIDERCRQGLRFMAEDIPRDMPFFEDEIVDYTNRRAQTSKVARNTRIVEMAEEGIGKKRIARELGCSVATVRAVVSGLQVRSGRIVSADGDSEA